MLHLRPRDTIKTWPSTFIAATTELLEPARSSSSALRDAADTQAITITAGVVSKYRVVATGSHGSDRAVRGLERAFRTAPRIVASG
jgi:hypothetical protein